MTHPLLGRAYRGAELFAAALFAAMLAAFVVQVLSRYVFNMPVPWSLEVCSITYVWVVFWSCDILVEERQQIRFDVLYNLFAPRQRRFLAIANTSALGLIFLAALPGTFDYIQFMGRRGTMVLHIPLNIVYACFGIFMVAAVVGAGLRVRRLFGPNWRTQL